MSKEVTELLEEASLQNDNFDFEVTEVRNKNTTINWYFI